MTMTSPFTALAALLLVVGLILAAQRAFRSGWLPRRAGALPAGARMRVLQVLALDTRRRLHLVQCDGREVLLLTGGATDQVVGWLGQGQGS